MSHRELSISSDMRWRDIRLEPSNKLLDVKGGFIMSMKNRVLLHRSGRNQFGDPGEEMYERYVPSPEIQAKHDAEKQRHIDFNEKFIIEYGSDWLNLMRPLKKKQVWESLKQFGRPSDSTLYAYARECASFEEFLYHWLLSNKRRGLRILGKSAEEIEIIMAPFKECGGWVVTYGKSSRYIAGI